MSEIVIISKLEINSHGQKGVFLPIDESRLIDRNKLYMITFNLTPLLDVKRINIRGNEKIIIRKQ